MSFCVDVANEDIIVKREVTELRPGVEVANLTFDPVFVVFDFPLWVVPEITTLPQWNSR